jgi:hypothetical protein
VLALSFPPAPAPASDDLVESIGERLFALISATQPELASKITGMLLEMDNSELLDLLGSHQHAALNHKIAEALQVLYIHDDPLTPAALAACGPGAANSKQRKDMIGERLFALISATQPVLASKITGMLLEMDNSEFLDLLGSHEALNSKIAEALQVLYNYDDPLTPAALATAADSKQRKDMIGQRLYPLILATQPVLASKITGMLLEMDDGELLHLLESDSALNSRIAEALGVI